MIITLLCICSLSTFNVAHIIPTNLGNFLLPLFLLLYLKNIDNNITHKIILIVFLLALPLVHPVITISSMLIIISMSIFVFIYSRIHILDHTDIEDLGIMVLLMIVSFIWWSPTRSFASAILAVASAIEQDSELNAARILVGNIDKASTYGYSVIEQTLKMYGDFLILLLLIFFMFPFVVKTYYLRRKDDLSICLYLYAQVIVLVIITGLLFLINSSFSPYRLIPIIFFVNTIIFGFCIDLIVNHSCPTKNKLNIPLFIILLLLIIPISVNSTFRFYQSNYILVPNSQVTETEMHGMNWFLNKKNIDISFVSLTIPGGRFEDLMMSPESRIGRKDLSRFGHENMPPYHFGYDRFDFLEMSFPSINYLIINEMGRCLYTKVFPEIAVYRFNASDFDKLESDSSLDLVYSNSGFECYLVGQRLYRKVETGSST